MYLKLDSTILVSDWVQNENHYLSLSRPFLNGRVALSGRADLNRRHYAPHAYILAI